MHIATLQGASQITYYSTNTAFVTVIETPFQQPTQFYQYYKLLNRYSVPFTFSANLLINFNRDRNVFHFMVSPFESVNLRTGLYCNLNTNQTAAIQQGFVPNHLPKVRWHTTSNPVAFVFMEEAVSDYLEHYYQQYLLDRHPARSVIVYTTNGEDYQTEFSTMVETNLSSGRSARLDRMMI